MKSNPHSIAYRVSTGVLVLTVAASALGLFADGLYRDNALVASSWIGNDLVTLFVASPLLAGSLLWTRWGSPRARLVLMGLLAYTLYNFAFYLFGTAFNSLFLVYVAIFTLSAAGLIAGLISIDAATLHEQFGDRVPARWIAGYMMVVALGLGLFWTASSLEYVFTGDVPAMVEAVGLHTNLIAALDLSMVVSVGLVAGV